MPDRHIAFQLTGGDKAGSHLPELRALYGEVYAEPPYEWGQDHAALFAERFEVQRRQDGFALAEARDGAELAGFAFGVTLQPSTPWWQNLTKPLPAEVTTEQPGRTFALVELLVRARWRRQHIAQALHDLLLKDRPRGSSHAERPPRRRPRARRLPHMGLAQDPPETQPAPRVPAVRCPDQAAL